MHLGVRYVSQDIDLLARAEDLERIREAARDCGFVFASLPMDFSSSGITIHRFTKLIGEVPLMLDLVIADGPLAAVWQTRQTVAFEGGPLHVVHREGLITMKLAAGRPQDIADIKRLTELGRG